MDYGFKIGVTLPLAQWSYTERIRNALEQRLLSYGCEMLFFCADNEEQKQAEQIEAMAAEGMWRNYRLACKQRRCLGAQYG